MTKNLYDLTDEQIRRASNLYNMKIEEKIRKGEFLTLDEFKRIYVTLLDSIIFMESLAVSDYRFDEVFEDCDHTVSHMKHAAEWIDDYISCCQDRTGFDRGSVEVLPSDRSKDLEGD